MVSSAAPPGSPNPTATPESVGFSSQRLERLHALIQDEIDHKQLAGAITILARHGKIMDYRTYGQRDMATGAAMTRDTIFRDYSMTKPVTGVAMMILYEAGQMAAQRSDRQIHSRVCAPQGVQRRGCDGKMILVDPEHAPTMRELMSHSAGFSYGSGKTPVDAMYQDLKPMQSANLQEMIDKLAKIPLNYQPGKGWTYSVSMDIEGYIVEKLSGQSLPDFMRDHIFTPLGMKDAGFFVPDDKRSRFATNYRDDGSRAKLVAITQRAAACRRIMPSSRRCASGGGGLVSTAEDYYRFAQMLANGGELERRAHPGAGNGEADGFESSAGRICSRAQFGIGQHIMRPGFGYGFNCAVVFDPPRRISPDGKGTFFWDGAAGTWFWVDPTNDIVFVGMIQRMTSPDNHALLYRSHATVYQALVDPAK